jgi:hypothetical protein
MQAGSSYQQVQTWQWNQMEGELAKNLGPESIKLQGWRLSYSTLVNNKVCNNKN